MSEDGKNTGQGPATMSRPRSYSVEGRHLSQDYADVEVFGEGADREIEVVLSIDGGARGFYSCEDLKDSYAWGAIAALVLALDDAKAALARMTYATRQIDAITERARKEADV